MGCKPGLFAHVDSPKAAGNCGNMSCEQLDRCFLKHRCPQGVAGCSPSAMMVNARPCAFVTHRAVEVDLSWSVESRRHCESEKPLHKTFVLSELLRLDARRKLCYTVNRTVAQWSSIPVRIERASPLTHAHTSRSV